MEDVGLLLQPDEHFDGLSLWSVVLLYEKRFSLMLNMVVYKSYVVWK